MNNNTLSISEVGSVLMGAGLVQLDNLVVGLGLISAGVLLKCLVAILNKNNIPVSQQG